MDFWVGVTDNDWYEFLASLQPDEVNFWQPSGTPPFKRQGIELFLFKLHSPQNFIVGGGYFVTYVNLPISIAWETFGEKNGVKSYSDLKGKITLYRESRGRRNIIDPEIGCSVLAEPFFFPRHQWIPVPEDWASNIVRGKTYSTEKETGRILFEQVQERLSQPQASERLFDPSHEDDQTSSTTGTQGARYGAEFTTRARLGQGSFRAVVTQSYHRRCAMTGERTLPVLEAAHIKGYAESGPHDVTNGILLRADLHKLFDKYLITITPDYHIEVSGRIREEYENGKDYYALQGKKLIVLPEKEEEYPAKQFITWHNDQFAS
jgi:putative restriction endonuclease